MFVLFGATGFIGHALQSALALRRTPFLGFGRERCVRSDGEAVTESAIRTPAARAELLQALPAPDAIIFAAGVAATGTDAQLLQASHFDSLLRAFESIPEPWWKDRPFLYTSSSLVYQTPPYPHRLLTSDPVGAHSAYAEVKLRCESFVAKTIAAIGARITIARLFNIAGSGQRAGIVSEIANQAIEIESNRRPEFHLRNNEPVLDLVDVDEAAAALLALAETPSAPEVVNVCSGRAVTTEDLIAAARRAIGRPVPVTYDVATDRRQMRVGNPDLMLATTGWQAHRSVDDIVAAVISSARLAEGMA